MYEELEVTGQDARDLYRMQRALEFARDRAKRLKLELEAKKFLVLATANLTSADHVEFVIGPTEVLIAYQTS